MHSTPRMKAVWKSMEVLATDIDMGSRLVESRPVPATAAAIKKEPIQLPAGIMLVYKQ